MPFSLRDVLNVAVAATDDDLVSPGLLTKDQLDLGWNSASGGEKRRTLLTRALLLKPALVVLDEPFNHLDQASRNVMVSAIGRFATAHKTSSILSTHEGFAKDAAISQLSIKRIAL